MRRAPADLKYSSPTPFHYQPLETEDTIRLLHIHPGVGEAPLLCSLSHQLVGSKEFPSYRAISYAWDHGSAPVPVPCNQQSLPLPFTIYQLLLRIRDTDEELLLWIDAICINQVDNDEKSIQVQKMHMIYSAASSVVVWLGEEDDETPWVNELLSNVKGYLEANGQRNEAWTMPWYLNPHWTYLARLLGRTWFRRTWILQEVALARECQLRCGSFSWDWQQLLLDLGSVRKSYIPQALPPLEQGLFQGAVHFCLENLDNNGWSSEHLIDLLHMATSTYATNPRDKVFAFLRLLQDDGLDIKVDYRHSVQRVYKDTAVQAIGINCADILSVAGDSAWNATAGLPSWVPDWSCSTKPERLSTAFAADRSHNLHEQYPRHFALSNGLLGTRAIRIDRVSATAVPWSGNTRRQVDHTGKTDVWDVGELTYSRIQGWQRLLHRCGNKQGTYQSTGQSLKTAFASTITADSGDMRTSCPDRIEELYNRYASRVREVRAMGTRLPESQHYQTHHMDDALNNFYVSVKEMCFKRTFFVTKKGYMGLGPFFTLPCDRIFVVPGVNTPLVMRRTLRGRYRLVGQCYIHGLMSGEALELGLPMEEIRIE